MASRLDAPVLGAFDELPSGEQKWQVSFSWRYQRSDRHFRGTHEEANRAAEDSEVINTLNLGEIAIRYNINPRTSIAVGVPFLMATRSHPIRDENRVVVDRSILNSRGMSDVTIVARRLMWEPKPETRGNIFLGFGVKLPTGAASVTDTRARLEDGERVTRVETVDQSVQPGDGGFGFIIDVSAYRLLGQGGWALYASGAYLINPQATSGVETYRTRSGEEIMSIADQYVARAGFVAGPKSWNGLSVGLGGRIEGVAVHDLFGSSEGFRRPGYAVSAEPSLSWARGSHSFSFAIPIAIQRNRQRSVPDFANDRHGDAAFADWLVLASYSRRF